MEKILKTGLVLSALVIGSQLAFAPEIRREVFRRDQGVCRCSECFWSQIGGHPALWREGFNMQAAHYPDFHQRGIDYNPHNGRMLCTTDHIFEEISRDNFRGALLLWQGHSIRRHGWYDEDWKMPFEWYVDYIETDENGQIGLIEAYLEQFDIHSYI